VRAGADPVQLTDLEVITRWSLAVRGGEAERDELIAVLRDDLAWLESTRPKPTRPAPARATAPVRRRRAARA